MPSRQWAWGGKVPLPHGPADGEAGLRANVEFLAAHRDKVGAGYPLMVDCYMSLDVPYAIRLAEAASRSTSTGGRRCCIPTTSRVSA
jgi:L-alanine-DL-glutamate epimerase-like enolase superfamily enzyme